MSSNIEHISNPGVQPDVFDSEGFVIDFRNFDFEKHLALLNNQAKLKPSLIPEIGPDGQETGISHLLSGESPKLELVQANNIAEPVIEWASEPEVTLNQMSSQELSFGGLKRALAITKAWRLAASDRSHLYSGKVVDYSSKAIGAAMSVPNRIKSSEHKPGSKTVAGVLLGGLALATTAYLTSKYGLPGPSRAHEAAQVIPAKAPHHPAELIQPHAPAPAAHSPIHHKVIKSVVQSKKIARDVSSASQAFKIEPGHGFTQELTESFSSKTSQLSPERSLKLFSALRQHFGDHGILKHCHGLVDKTYTQDGQLYIGQSGRGQWANGVSSFARLWVKRHPA